jgi:hypothetical protein
MAPNGTRMDGSATLGCPGRTHGKKNRNSGQYKFFRMPFVARSALADDRQADAPAHSEFRVKEESAIGTQVQMCQLEGV